MSENYREWHKWLAGVAFSLLAAIAPTSTMALADDRPDLVIAVQKNPATVEPAHQLSNVAVRVHYNITDTLIDIDFLHNLKLIPGLATEWKRIDDKTVELKLRRNVKFHNGDELTTEDVVFTFGPERMTSKDAPVYALARPYWGILDRIEAIDRYTVRFVSKASDPLLEQRIAGLTSPIINKRAYLEAPSFEEWSYNVIGTGPFRVKEIRANEYILLEAFDEYWAGKPTVKTVKFVVVPEISTRVAGLATGEYHIITEIPPDQLGKIDSYPDLEAVGGPVNNHRLLAYDTNHPILADVNVRRVLNLAIDRELIVQTLWNGRTRVPNGLQWEFYGDMYLADWPKPEYNPEKARELLKNTNYKGEEIPFRVLQDYYTNEIATAQVLLEMWKAVGLNVKMIVKENWQQVFDKEGRGIRNWSNTTVYPDPVGALWRLHGISGYQQYIEEWKDDEFNRLGKILEESTDLTERKEAYRKMMQIWDWENPPCTILHQLAIFYGKRKEVNWTPYEYTYMDLRPRNLTFK